MDPILVITNSAAGSADEAVIEQALTVLREHASVEVAATSTPDELDGVLHRAGPRLIVVAGGDGSLHAVISALYRRKELTGRTLGLLPLGTGNDFARGADIPLDAEEAARLIVSGQTRAVDLIVDDEGGVTVNNVHIGAGAQASRIGHNVKGVLGKFGIGKLGYPIGAAVAAFRPPKLRLRIEVDGQVRVDVDDPVLMVALGNGGNVGGGTELNPEAEVDSGVLDVMISRATGPLAKLGYVGALVRGRHLERDDVLNVEGRNVRVSGEEFYVSSDGELDGPVRSRSWRLIKGAYQMVLPASSEA